MDVRDEVAKARGHPAVIASMVVAGVAVTAFALVGIAYLLGLVPKNGAAAGVTATTPTTSARQGGGTIDLLPGETLVLSPEPPRSAIPQYNKPAPVPAPATTTSKGTVLSVDVPRPSPPPPPPQVAVAPPAPPAARMDGPFPPEPRPSTPSYARPAPPPRETCANCGTIAGVYADGYGRWEIRVRFDDGSTETMYTRRRPSLASGQRVRLEEGRLVVD